MGGRPPQAPHLHRSRGRSPQPVAARLLEGAALERLLLHPGGAQPGDRREVRPRPGPDRWERLRVLLGLDRARSRHRPARGPGHRLVAGRGGHARCTRSSTCSCWRPLINGLGHWRGGQNFENTAYNSRVLAWLTGGESLHNNHHAFPRSPKFSLRRSELDPSWLAIRVLAALRLVADRGRRRSARGRGSRPSRARMGPDVDGSRPARPDARARARARASTSSSCARACPSSIATPWRPTRPASTGRRTPRPASSIAAWPRGSGRARADLRRRPAAHLPGGRGLRPRLLERRRISMPPSAPSSRATPTRTWPSSPAGCGTCVTHPNRPGEPVCFVDLDGVNDGRPRRRPHPRDRFPARGGRRRRCGSRRAHVAAIPSIPSTSRIPRLGVYERLAEFVAQAPACGTGRLHIALDPGERHAALTVNEFETLLMKYDLAAVLRDPLRFMAEQYRSVLANPRAVPGKALGYAKYDLVRVLNSGLDTLGLKTRSWRRCWPARWPCPRPASSASGAPCTCWWPSATTAGAGRSKARTRAPSSSSGSAPARHARARRHPDPPGVAPAVRRPRRARPPRSRRPGRPRLSARRSWSPLGRPADPCSWWRSFSSTTAGQPRRPTGFPLSAPDAFPGHQRRPEIWGVWFLRVNDILRWRDADAR